MSISAEQVGLPPTPTIFWRNLACRLHLADQLEQLEGGTEPFAPYVIVNKCRVNGALIKEAPSRRREKYKFTRRPGLQGGDPHINLRGKSNLNWTAIPAMLDEIDEAVHAAILHFSQKAGGMPYARSNATAFASDGTFFLWASSLAYAVLSLTFEDSSLANSDGCSGGEKVLVMLWNFAHGET